MGELLGVYIFGSVARGDRDAHSDLDLLAIVVDGAGVVPAAEVERHVPPSLSALDRSISWYGRNRLGEMFRNGELFAWHLYWETLPLFERQQVLAELGAPSPYTGGVSDVASFEKILTGVPDQLVSSPKNAIYELGLIYVCLRNICMAASWTLCARPDFSRYSPFLLKNVEPAPISPDEYDVAMRCRMAGQRGLVPPLGIEPSIVVDIHGRLMPWIAHVRAKLEV
jgi:hypothetical protein